MNTGKNKIYQVHCVLFAIFTFALFPLSAQRQPLFVVKVQSENKKVCELYDSLGKPLSCGRADYFFRCDSLIFSSIQNQYALWSADGKTKLADSLEEVRCAWSDGIAFMAQKLGMWRYYTADGRPAVPGAWEKVSDFYKGVAMVYNGSRDIFINRNGATPDSITDAIREHFQWQSIYEGAVAVADIPSFRHPEYTVFNGPSGVGIKRKSDQKIILDAAFERIVSNTGDYVIVVKQSRYGVFHLKKETMLIPCQYIYIHDEI